MNDDAFTSGVFSRTVQIVLVNWLPRLYRQPYTRVSKSFGVPASFGVHETLYDTAFRP